MSFDYSKNKQGHNSDSFWTSYSDLFLGLSTIFLLLYVTSSLRTGTDAIKQQVDNRKLAMENEELKSQLKMYEAVKQNYMEKEATKSEAQEYQELMDKLTLLEEDAKDERDKLAKEKHFEKPSLDNFGVDQKEKPQDFSWLKKVKKLIKK